MPWIRYAAIVICAFASAPGVAIAVAVLAFGAATPGNWVGVSGSWDLVSLLCTGLGLLYIVYLGGLIAGFALAWTGSGWIGGRFPAKWVDWMFVAGFIVAVALEIIFFEDPKRFVPRGMLALPFVLWATAFWLIRRAA